MTYPDQVDFHMHTSVSDGSDTPDLILKHVKQAGIEIFSVTDHDALKGCKIIQSLLNQDDPLFVSGVEFSCRDGEGQYHILGYGYDPDSAPIRNVVETGHYYRMKKVYARIEYLRNVCHFSFPREELDALFALDNPGKPHIANLMVKYGFAETKEQAFLQYLNNICIKNEYVHPEEAIAGILESGGIPVLAHPCYGNGDQLILGDELDRRVQRLMDYGLQGLEGFYSGFSSTLRAQVVALAERYGLYVTAGSDYHGTNKMVMLGDTGLDSEAEMPEGFKRFIEAVAGFTNKVKN